MFGLVEKFFRAARPYRVSLVAYAFIGFVLKNDIAEMTLSCKEMHNVPQGFLKIFSVLAPLADEAASAFVSVAIGLLEGSPHAELARHFY